MKNFEDFLMDKHAEDYTGAGDDIGEAFDCFITSLEIDDWLRYGDLFAKKQNRELVEALKEFASQSVMTPKNAHLFDKARLAISHAEGGK